MHWDGAWYGFTHSLTSNKNMLLKRSIPEENVIKISVHFPCYCSTGCHVWFLSGACSEVVNFVLVSPSLYIMLRLLK